MDIVTAHQESFKNKEKLKVSAQCGCFYCLKIFSPEFIKQYVDDNQTALCPHCGIDSILPESSQYSLAIDFLEKMRNHWFCVD